MRRVGVAILGVGVVGGGTFKTLVDHREFYQKTQNVDIVVESVLDNNRERALSIGVPEEALASSIAEVVANPNVDIVVETIGGCGVAKDFILAALRQGKTVVTANKELICKFSHELEREAKRNSCGLYYEASCVGGVPIIRTLLDGVQANHITSMMGIINGTTNYILTQMAQSGAQYEDALKEAQRLCCIRPTGARVLPAAGSPNGFRDRKSKSNYNARKGVDSMNIAFLAHDKKKELMVQFCTAYKSVLIKHSLYATATTGRLIADHTGLPITLLLSHKQGGHQQINARIAYNEIDLVLLFADPNNMDPWDDSQMIETIRHCDKHNVPIATNLASAEMFIMGLQRGDLDWREMLRTKPRY